MPGRLCPECENINEIPKMVTVFDYTGKKIKVQVCRYCDAGFPN